MPNLSRFRFSSVLVLFLAYWALAPLLGNFIRVRILADLAFSLVLLSVVFGVSRGIRQKLITGLLALPMLLSIWMEKLFSDPRLELTGSIFEVLFFGYASFLILSFVLRTPRVTRELIYAALLVYVFLGLIWTGVYSALELLQPNSFSLPESLSGPVSHSFAYFSFTTLTTLGYGDITPLSGPARSFATMEAVVGQIYLAVLVARLVGLHISHSSGPKD
jgi:hypothetical protein